MHSRKGRSSRAIGLCPRVICDDFVTGRRLGLGSHLYRIVSGNQGEPIFVGENRQNHPGLGALFLRHGYYPALNSFLISTLRSGLVVRIPVGTAISRPVPSFLISMLRFGGDSPGISFPSFPARRKMGNTHGRPPAGPAAVLCARTCRKNGLTTGRFFPNLVHLVAAKGGQKASGMLFWTYMGTVARRKYAG